MKVTIEWLLSQFANIFCDSVSGPVTWTVACDKEKYDEAVFEVENRLSDS